MNLALRCMTLVLAVCLAGCPLKGGRSPGPGGPATQAPAPGPVAGATPDTRFNQRFTRFGGGWTGADGTYSVGLPDGRTVWIFGDTFLGRVNAGRSRPTDSPLINNCFVVQANDCLSTRHGGTAESPRALVAPSDNDGWYWPADGSVEKETLRVFFRRFHSTGADPWQLAWTGTAIASFSLPGLDLDALTPLRLSNGVMYGASILETPAYTYIYGTEDRLEAKYAHLARAPTGHLTGPWKFFTGAGWSAHANHSARILEGVANQYSVLPVQKHYLLITMDNRTPFSNLIVGYLASAPGGPWRGPVSVYAAPEAEGDIVAYNAFAHPQFTKGGRLLVSYNLNSVSDFTRSYTDADSYRPRFVRVDVARLVGLFGDGNPKLEN